MRNYKLDPILLKTKQVLIESMQRLSEREGEDAISVMSARDILQAIECSGSSSTPKKKLSKQATFGQMMKTPKGQI